jgi:hypothetical protein
MTINASAEAVWETISRFGGLEEFIPAVASCSLEGSGVGAMRSLALQDGGMVHERLETLDEAARTLQYSITESPLPFTDYLATMQVRDAGSGQCEIEWSSTFEPDGVSEAEAVEMLQGIYRGGIEGLEKMLGG